MSAIALLIAENVASDAPDRRADAYLFDIQLDILRKGFAVHDLAIEPVRWTEKDADWGKYAAVLVFSAWDYQDNHEAFLATLDRISALGIPVFNEPPLVRWNIRKTYLRDFDARGVAVIPTLWPEQPAAADIREAMAAFGTDDVVLKRQVAGGARAQVRYTRANLPPDGLVMDRPGMIQPFVPAIVIEGEYSFLFVDGGFSHALVKRSAAGDYRIQEAYGGRSHRVDPAPRDLSDARAVLDALDAPPLYARVDMVRGNDGRLLLMELEVIEPFLFPREGPHIGEMLGKALRKRLG
jgi:hypothetical protein